MCNQPLGKQNSLKKNIFLNTKIHNCLYIYIYIIDKNRMIDKNHIIFP